MSGEGTAPGLREEQAALGVPASFDEEMFDVVNLSSRDSGIAGVIFVSTAMGSHGPRVKWYPGRPGRDLPCLTVTLEATPRVINHGLSRAEAALGETPVLQWVQRNRPALLDFWHNGLGWTREEVNAFIDGLAKLP